MLIFEGLALTNAAITAFKEELRERAAARDRGEWDRSVNFLWYPFGVRVISGRGPSVALYGGAAELTPGFGV